MLAASIGVGVMSLGSALACAVGRPTVAVPTDYLMALSGTLGIAAINFVGFVVDHEPAPGD
jgi:hypothetical protein